MTKQETIDAIRHHAWLRNNHVRAEIRSANHCRAMLQGWIWNLGSNDRKKERARVSKLTKEIYARFVKAAKNGGPDPEDAEMMALVMVPLQQALIVQPFRAREEKVLTELVKHLPSYGFVERTKGFGELSLALVVGAAGDLSEYRSPARLWKRLGVATIDGERQRRVTGDKELAIRHGFNPERAAIAWNIGECQIKGGAYRHVFDEYKARQAEQHPDLSKAQLNNRARRYVAKRVLRELWIYWRECEKELAA